MNTLPKRCIQHAAQPKRSGFTLIELVASIGILTILIASFAASLRGIMTLENNYAKETSAIILVGNAMQRMAAADQTGPEPLRSLCEAELQRNILLDPADTTITTTDKDGKARLTIGTSTGTPLVEIEL